MAKLFRRPISDESVAVSTTEIIERSQPPGTTLYVDTENLQGSTQALLKTIIEEWPKGFPPVMWLNLYVAADRVALWDMWASSQFPQVSVTVKGIQHFSHQQSKNSADIAIAIDAVADFVMDTTQFVAVMSDDSDFMPVYAKLKDLVGGEAPFLWVLTDRAKTRSSTIKDYFPNDHVHVVSIPQTTCDLQEPLHHDGDNSDQTAEMVNLINQGIAVGLFKSTDCQPIIKSRWPHHPMASMASAPFGSEFASKLWPTLEKRGVQLSRVKPRRYEMTAQVKETLNLRQGRQNVASDQD